MRHAVVLVAFCLAAAGVYAAADVPVFSPAQRSFWSLQPVTKPAVPAVTAKVWVKNPIDAFVLAKLEAKQIQPNKPADPLTLLRRVTIDLTGLPPTRDEIQAFLNDRSLNARNKSSRLGRWPSIVWARVLAM